jgi:DNA-binding transcriptional LysR family regulator
VSRQIRQLEDKLGVPLFERRHREIRLTEAGQTLYRAVVEALALLRDATARLQDLRSGKTVTVSCSIGFASLWLIPRLAELREQQPGLDLRISANNQLLDLERERIELAIRYCPPAMAPPGALRLFGEEVFPVCAPSLLKRRQRPLVTPDDLRHHVLLVLDDEVSRSPARAWRVWLEVAQLRELVPAGTLHFNHYDQVIQAAVDGQGVALGVSPLVRRLMREGRLVALFEQRFASPRAYHLVTARSAAARPEVQELVRWIVRKAKAESRAAAARPKP